MDDGVAARGGRGSARCQWRVEKLVIVFHMRASLPEYGGLGGTGGHSNLPKESEKDGAPSLTLSRLQLLGVGLTYSTQKHHESLNRL